MPEFEKSEQPAADPLAAGTVLRDQYSIVSRAGAGLNAFVYHAADVQLGRPLAVKEIISVAAEPSQRDIRAREFQGKAGVLAHLRHPSIPKIYDYFIEGDRYYLVMTWIDGEDLRKRMRKNGGPFEERLVTGWAIQVCDALDYLHACRPPIIHQDLNPANLMLGDRSGRVILLGNFGIARIVSPGPETCAIGYAPPEFFTGKTEPRSDLYSLGMTMLYLLTGFDPEHNPLTVVDLGISPPRIPIGSRITPEMEGILIRMMAGKPEDRPVNALDAMHILEDHYANLEGKRGGTRQSAASYSGNEGAAESGLDVTGLGVPYAYGYASPLREGPSTSPTGALAETADALPDRRFCTQCGRQVPARCSFCPYCGAEQRPINVKVMPSPTMPDAAKASDTKPLPAKRLLSQVYDDDVMFTVYGPATVPPQRWCTLLAFAHLSKLPDAAAGEPDPMQEVQRQAQQILGKDVDDYKKLSTDSSSAVPRSGEILIRPFMPGVEFNPPARSFRWEETVHREEFKLRASASLDGQVGRGWVRVYLGPLILAQINLSIRVDSRPEALIQPPAATRGSARPLRRVFASYSHKDSEVVKRIEEIVAQSHLGIEYLRDATKLRAGEIWNAELMRMIRAADMFQLFWSWNSMSSQYVRQEIDYALSLDRPSFVLPVYWEVPFPQRPEENLPPEELKCLHFEQLGGMVGTPRPPTPASGTPEAATRPSPESKRSDPDEPPRTRGGGPDGGRSVPNDDEVKATPDAPMSPPDLAAPRWAGQPEPPAPPSPAHRVILAQAPDVTGGFLVSAGMDRVGAQSPMASSRPSRSRSRLITGLVMIVGSVGLALVSSVLLLNGLSHTAAPPPGPGPSAGRIDIGALFILGLLISGAMLIAGLVVLLKKRDKTSSR
jgi:hypothetical protein